MKRTLLILLMLFSSNQVSANSYFHPKWSPDGSQIAFYGYVGKTPDIFVVDVKTGKVVNVTQTKDNWEIEPRWIDDNALVIASGANMKKIRMTQLNIGTNKQALMTGHVELQLFIASSENPGEMLVNWKKNQHWGFYQMNRDGSNVKPITSIPGIFVHQVFLGQKLALATLQDNIVLIGLDGKIVRYLVKNTNKQESPHLSSDRTKLLYLSTVNAQRDIYLKNLTTGKVQRLTNDETSKYSPQFSPQNDYFVFAGVEKDKIDILAMDLSGKVIGNFTKDSH